MSIRKFIKPIAILAIQVLFITPIFAVDDLTDVIGLDRTASINPASISGLNNHGIDKTYSTAGYIDFGNPFFKKFGTNDRTCATCHVPTEGWVITPKGVKDRFEKTAGLDPLFRLVDGANSPLADVSTVEKRRAAYSMLLNKAILLINL